MLGERQRRRDDQDQAEQDDPDGHSLREVAGVDLLQSGAGQRLVQSSSKRR